MKHTEIVHVLQTEPTINELTIKGWVRSFRSNRFISVNDGSTIKNLQCVIDFENFDQDTLKYITTGACVEITGVLVKSQGLGQTLEVQVSGIVILGTADPEQSKTNHSLSKAS